MHAVDECETNRLDRSGSFTRNKVVVIYKSLRIAKRTAARRKATATRLKPAESELIYRLAKSWSQQLTFSAKETKHVNGSWQRIVRCMAIGQLICSTPQLGSKT